jgi:hypothetical protein
VTREIRGSCLCGAVAFELTGKPVWAHNCHCSRCRKIHGAAFASNLFAPLDALRYTQGEDLLGSYKMPAAERFTHVFCKVCGSSLPFQNVDRGVVVVPMGSLDDDPKHPPDAHIFTDSKAPWFTITDSLPRHRAQLGGDSDADE